MYKSGLYFILYIAILFFSSLFGIGTACILLDIRHPFVVGFEDGLAGREFGYTSYDEVSLNNLLNGSSPFMLIFHFCTALIVTLIFLRAHFAKFSWGEIQKKDITSSLVRYALPFLGFTVLVHVLGSIVGLPVISPNYLHRSALGDIAINCMEWISYAIVIYGAIGNELLSAGKKTWQIVLILFCAFLLFSETADCMVSNNAGNYIYIAIITDIISFGYITWVYLRTRSLNLVTFVGLMAYIVPFTLYID